MRPDGSLFPDIMALNKMKALSRDHVGVVERFLQPVGVADWTVVGVECYNSECKMLGHETLSTFSFPYGVHFRTYLILPLGMS